MGKLDNLFQLYKSSSDYGAGHLVTMELKPTQEYIVWCCLDTVNKAVAPLLAALGNIVCVD